MAKIDLMRVIIRPIITEQGMHMVETLRAYPFAVDPRANKVQIREAVEKLFKVEVESVRTANRCGKKRRRGRTIGRTEDWKKAYVTLKEGHTIELF